MEIDLIVGRLKEKILCIKIKSSDNVREDRLPSIVNLAKNLKNNEASICKRS
jgi:hypothetical protein